MVQTSFEALPLWSLRIESFKPYSWSSICRPSSSVFSHTIWADLGPYKGCNKKKQKPQPETTTNKMSRVVSLLAPVVPANFPAGAEQEGPCEGHGWREPRWPKIHPRLTRNAANLGVHDTSMIVSCCKRGDIYKNTVDITLINDVPLEDQSFPLPCLPNLYRPSTPRISMASSSIKPSFDTSLSPRHCNKIQLRRRKDRKVPGEGVPGPLFSHASKKYQKIVLKKSLVIPSHEIQVGSKQDSHKGQLRNPITKEVVEVVSSATSLFP